MKLIKPFFGLRPRPRYVNQIIAPPYDVINRQQAKQLADNKPYSFLHITKPEIDLPEDTDSYSDIVYQTAVKNFQRFLSNDVFQRDNTACYYLYRLTQGKQQQLGLVAAASLEAYRKGVIKQHEKTRPVKETDRVHNIEALNAQPSPVMMTYLPQEELDTLLKQYSQSTPAYDIEYQQVRHEFWVIDDSEQVDAVTAAFDGIKALYIADGHHRVAAANQVAKQREADEDDPANYVLAVLFPANQLHILGYHRVFNDLNNLTPEQFMQAITPVFHVTKSTQAVVPKYKGQLGLYLDHQWYVLDIKKEFCQDGDPAKMLEVNLLRKNIVDTVLDIKDPRNDTRVDFVGGQNSLQELQQRVDSGQAAVAFSLYPTSIEELIAVSNKGDIMPPKSTWFEPKLADGLILYRLD